MPFDIPILFPAIAAGTLISLLVVISIIKSLLFICRPNEILIFSGRKHVGPDGHTRGYRVVQGGRAFRRPIVESVERMDISLISISMQVAGAYSKGLDDGDDEHRSVGIPLTINAIANVKVSSEKRYIGNAIERFLGHGRAEIARVAKETLEGHLRGVLATMTPEEVNEDRLKFAEKLEHEAEMDLQKLGLHLDTLKIQHVTDQRDYLESIGRRRVAEVLANAKIAESDAQRAAEEAEAEARARAEVAKTNATANVQRKQNELRQVRADLEGTAKSAEERAEASALRARAEAEHELQQIRGELEQLRLQADVTIPAEIGRRVRQLQAAGRAASIRTDGAAMAESLEVIAEAWAACGGRAMDMYVLQNLDEIFAQVAQAAKKLQVREVNLLDSGDGETLPAYASAYPATIKALLAQVSATLGVDVSKVITGDGTTGSPPARMPPPSPPPSLSTPNVTPAAR